MESLLELWLSIYDDQGKAYPVTDGPITSAISATIVLTELGMFSTSTVTLPGSDRRAPLCLNPDVLIEVVQPGLAGGDMDRGTLMFGYATKGEQDIAEDGTHVIVLTIEPITSELLWYNTRRGWVAQNWLSVIAEQIASLHPKWHSLFTGTGTALNDLQVSVSRNQDTLQGAYLAIAKQFGVYARMGIDPTTGGPSDVLGNPVRMLEMGAFGAAPTVWLTSANGAQPSELPNSVTKLIATIQRIPADATNLCNVTVPFGGGASTDTVVNLERLWRIVNDTSYPGFAQFGTDAESIARTGKPSLFPEYDHTNYPITDPQTLNYSGAPTYDTDGNLLQGGWGTRAVTRDGHWDYVVMDVQSHGQHLHHDRPFTDSSLTYTDNSPANQELTERALYLSTIANFKRFSQPHHSFACTVASASGRPTRAGDLIAIDYQQISIDQDNAAVVEMNVTDTLRVMRVTRQFPQMIDEYVLSNLGRFEEDDTSAAVGAAQQMVSLGVQQGTGLAKDTVVITGNIDAGVGNEITHWWYIPPEHFRYHMVRVRCDFFPFRGTATTSYNPAGTPVVTIGDVELLIATPNDISAQSAPIAGPFKHFHRVPVGGATLNLNIPSVPYNSPPNLYMWMGGSGNVDNNGAGGMSLRANTSSGGSLGTGSEIYLANNDMTPTAHVHKVANKNDTIAHIPANTTLGPLPQHVHDLEKKIPTGQPSPASITMRINGTPLSSGAQATGTRDTTGAFTSSFIVSDIGPYLDNITPGTDVPITFTAGVSADNLAGVGWLQLTFTAVEELGGLVSKGVVVS